MSKSIRRESPLVGCHLATHTPETGQEAGVLLGERPFIGHINLRGDASEPAFLKAVAGVLGFNLPGEPNTVAEGNGQVVYWLGPNEWLLVIPQEQESELIFALRAALSEVFAAITDISSGQTVIAIDGEHARDLLAKGCTLDLHPRVFRPGTCAQTLLAKAPVLIRHRPDAPLFELIVRRSFADYLWRWLEEAAKEFGMTIMAPAVSEAPSASKVAALRDRAMA
jgi:sarcosine oxidase subunit gamma